MEARVLPDKIPGSCMARQMVAPAGPADDMRPTAMTAPAVVAATPPAVIAGASETAAPAAQGGSWIAVARAGPTSMRPVDEVGRGRRTGAPVRVRVAVAAGLAEAVETVPQGT